MPRLTLRDDDYRLSFLQGNFVTLTNVTDEDVERIVTCGLEPMNVSIHAISPDVRRKMIGAHAARGVEVLEALCESGVEVHAQIVLCPGLNDGNKLHRTLDWVEERANITSLAIVPMGYTKHSKRFDRSFSDDVEASRAVVRLIEPYQERARKALGNTRFQLSDEFYVDADLPVPPRGDLRWLPAVLRRHRHAEELSRPGVTPSCAPSGRGSARPWTPRWVRRASASPSSAGEAAEKTIAVFAGLLSPEGRVWTQAIRNDYFGGDVNVTGLIVSRDLLAPLANNLSDIVVVLPEVMFNFDHVTLDGDTQAHIVEEISLRGGTPVISEPSPGKLLDCLHGLLV